MLSTTKFFPLLARSISKMRGLQLSSNILRYIYIYIHDSIIRLFFITLIWYENFAKVEQICHLPGRIVSVARSIERQQRTLSTSCFVLLCTKVEIEILKRHALHPCAKLSRIECGRENVGRGKKVEPQLYSNYSLSLF